MSYPFIFSVPGVGTFAEDIDAERRRQLDKFGDQKHPDLVGDKFIQVEARNMFSVLANNYRDINDGTVDTEDPDEGTLDWTGILLEEVYEALAESDPVKLREELIQCAAVIQAWVYDLDRNPNG